MRARRLLLGLFALFLLVGPIGRQAFGLRLPVAFKTWRMFTGTARDVCQIEVIAPAGLEVRGRVVRKHLPMIRRRLCHQARGLDLRIRTRCGSRGRWVSEDDGSTNACAP